MAAGTFLMLLPLVLLLSSSHIGAILWGRAIKSELFNRSFGGVRLCDANASVSVNITGIDQYTVPSASPTLFYHVRSVYTFYVLSCSMPPSPDGVYIYLKSFLISSIQWDFVCANTRNLTILVASSTGTPDTSFSTQPCNYTVQHAGLTIQQLTAWILLTYSADWTPDWVNRTADYPDQGGLATVVLRSETNQQVNFTWRNFIAYDLAASPMTPGQKAQAVLASMLTSTNWWLYICGVTNSSGNLLFTVLSQSYGSDASEFYINCNTRKTLVLGSPSSAVEEAAVSPTPAIESRSGGYWGRNLQRQLTAQKFGELTFCTANDTSNSSRVILVSTTDDIMVPDGTTIVRGTFEIRLTPCQTNISTALGDAHLKVFLRSSANWSDVCANSVNPIVNVNLADRTAVQFRPCPPVNNSALVDSTAAATKAAWCLLALNTSSPIELVWINRNTSSLIASSAASVTFRILGNANATALRWGNILVNGLTFGDEVDRLVRVFQDVDTAYWPVICQLINSSVGNGSADSHLSITITGGNGSKSINMYTNCSVSSKLTLLTTPTTRTITTILAGTNTTGTATLSPEERKALIDRQNLEKLKSGKQRDELATQVAVVVAALAVLVFLSTVGLVKMVLPRTA